MIKLTVVRHGESIGNAEGVIDDNSNFRNDTNMLSDKGILQAFAVSEKLLKKKFDVVIVSPLIRTLQTLAPYLKHSKHQVIISALTIERNAGVFAGMSKEAIKDFVEAQGIHDRVNFKPQDGESIEEVYQRAVQFIEYLQDNFDGKSVLLCGHSNFLKCLDIAIDNKDLEDFYSINSLKQGELAEYIIS